MRGKLWCQVSASICQRLHSPLITDVVQSVIHSTRKKHKLCQNRTSIFFSCVFSYRFAKHLHIFNPFHWMSFNLVFLLVEHAQHKGVKCFFFAAVTLCFLFISLDRYLPPCRCFFVFLLDFVLFLRQIIISLAEMEDKICLEATLPLLFLPDGSGFVQLPVPSLMQ